MNKEQFSTAMLTLVALVGMVLIANTVMAQSGQPWDEEYDSPAKLTTMTVDTNLTNLQTCQVARELKWNGTLTAKGKREACKPNRIDNRAAFWIRTTTTTDLDTSSYEPL